MDKNAQAKLSTEEQLKEAARRVFLRKGFAATTTRDIAEEAAQNLALLNYYFRSKKNLFDLVLHESTQQFFGVVAPLFHDPATSLQEKFELISARYIDLLLQEPDTALFVLNEMRTNPAWFSQHAPLMHRLSQSDFARQLVAQQPAANPVQTLLTFIGMLIYPFMLKPMLQITDSIDEAAFTRLMQERKKLVVQWMTIITA